MAKSNVKAVPPGFHTVTPALVVKGAAEAIEFYKKAFGAVELMRHASPGGPITHAQIRIGDSIIMLSDEFPGMGGKSPATIGAVTSSLYLYLEDVDAAFQKAVAAGAQATFPPMDMFWGDRMCTVTDPFAHMWTLASHIEDVSPAELQRRGPEFQAQMAKKKPG